MNFFGADPGPATPGDGIQRAAVFSDCGTYRYTLERRWDLAMPGILFVLLNPSVADAAKDDPTNRRGMDFARRWGYGSCVFVNLFAFRSPHPKVMKAAQYPVGPDNNQHIVEQARKAAAIVLAWGTDGGHMRRDLAVLKLLDGLALHCLKPPNKPALTKDGHPRHPLYLPKATELQRWEAP